MFNDKIKKKNLQKQLKSNRINLLNEDGKTL
jgi:hypothetical protein